MDGPDLEDPEIQTDDVFQHTSQLLGVDEVEWLELRFRIFAIDGNLITKSEWRTYTNSCVGGIFLITRGCWLVKLWSVLAKITAVIVFLAFRLAYRGDLTLSHTPSGWPANFLSRLF